MACCLCAAFMTPAQSSAGTICQDAGANELSEAPVAKDFTLNTVDGKTVNLMEYIKGKKLVLIDFWASWCAPCRKEGQNVKAIYEDYHAKGFDVLGVSLDTNKDAWVKAMKEEGYKWTQVSDLLGFKSPVVKDYEIKGIPALFLLDGNGNIVARDLRGNDLRTKVGEICK